MFQSLALDQSAYSDRTFCSWEGGWRALLLRRYTYHPEVEDAYVPPVAEQTIFLQLRGALTVESEDHGRWESARALPGSVSMTAPNVPARIRWRTLSTDPIETLELHLPAGTTSRVVEELWGRDPARVQFPDNLAIIDPVLQSVMTGLLDAALGGSPDLYAQTAAEFIAVHILTRHGALPAPRAFGGGDQRIRRGQSFLKEHLHLPVSLAEAAAEAGMSRYHFVRVFRQQTGDTPHRYLTRLRIERAQHELARGSASVSEIAGRCGFTSPAHFATAFRRQTGYSPSAYRALDENPRP